MLKMPPSLFVVRSTGVIKHRFSPSLCVLRHVRQNCFSDSSLGEFQSKNEYLKYSLWTGFFSCIPAPLKAIRLNTRCRFASKVINCS